MIRRILTGVLMLSVPVAAWGQSSDPDKVVADGGVKVKGWVGRIDPKSEKEGLKLSDAKFFSSGTGLHVTAGPPAVYWSPSNMATGNYTVKATFTQTKAPVHPEAYGLLMGGSKMDGNDQNYLYCVVFGSGMFSIKHRFGGEVHSLVERKVSGAIRQADAAGSATNEIAWKVDPANVSCMVNGTAVATFPRGELIGSGKLESTDGIYGIRVNHNLDVQITGFGMTKQ